ncbi:Exc2 family lipoprotein [Escherichia coli]|nr:Exc2 family lipoprotein [Escherichia coli]
MKDKAAGVSAEMAQQRVKNSTQKNFSFTPEYNNLCWQKIHKQRYAFAEKMKLMADTISAVYLDGYEGKE